MSVILIDLANGQNQRQCNWWNWTPTVEIVRRASLLEERQLELISLNGCGGTVSQDQARAIAQFIEIEILPKMKQDEMMHADGQISKQPSRPRPFLGTDPYDLYAARRSWLESFVGFCKTCGGFQVS